MGSYDFSFPSDTFTVPGDPAAVRGSAVGYGNFATTAAEGASGVRALAGGDGWVGDEGDLFRGKAGDLPPKLDVTHEAFGSVATALNGFADDLEAAQSRMAGERASALDAWNRLQGAKDAVTAHDRLGATTTFTTDAERLDFAAAGTRLANGVSSASSSWSAHLRAADAIRADAKDAARRAGNQIREAAKRSPTAGQSWASRRMERAGNWLGEHTSGLRTWIGEHANVIRWVSKAVKYLGMALFAVAAVLAVICAVAGFFTGGATWALLPGLFTLMKVGGAMWMAGDAGEKVADWGEGKISGQQLLVYGGTMVVVTVATVGLGKAFAAGGEAVFARWGTQIVAKAGPTLGPVLENLFGKAGAEAAGATVGAETGAARAGAAEAGESAGSKAVGSLIRQDDDFLATTTARGPKAHLDADGNLVPANPEGKATIVQHVRGQMPTKGDSPYTSFSAADANAKTFGGEVVHLDVERLQADIAAGKVSGVEVVSPAQVQAAIRADAERIAGGPVDLSLSPGSGSPLEAARTAAKELGLSAGKTEQLARRMVDLYNTTRDGEWLIKGIIPKDYLTGPVSK